MFARECEAGNDETSPSSEEMMNGSNMVLILFCLSDTLTFNEPLDSLDLPRIRKSSCHCQILMLPHFQVYVSSTLFGKIEEHEGQSPVFASNTNKKR